MHAVEPAVVLRSSAVLEFGESFDRAKRKETGLLCAAQRVTGCVESGRFARAAVDGFAAASYASTAKVSRPDMARSRQASSADEKPRGLSRLRRGR